MQQQNQYVNNQQMAQPSQNQYQNIQSQQQLPPGQQPMQAQQPIASQHQLASPQNAQYQQNTPMASSMDQEVQNMPVQQQEEIFDNLEEDAAEAQIGEPEVPTTIEEDQLLSQAPAQQSTPNQVMNSSIQMQQQQSTQFSQSVAPSGQNVPLQSQASLASNGNFSSPPAIQEAMQNLDENAEDTIFFPQQDTLFDNNTTVADNSQNLAAAPVDQAVPIQQQQQVQEQQQQQPPSSTYGVPSSGQIEPISENYNQGFADFKSQILKDIDNQHQTWDNETLQESGAKMVQTGAFDDVISEEDRGRMTGNNWREMEDNQWGESGEENEDKWEDVDYENYWWVGFGKLLGI